MAFRMSEQPRTIKIYNLLAGTNEFIGEGDAYIPPHTGLPANSTYIAPPDIPAGFVAVFNSDEASWHLVEDHRGKTVYDVASSDALFISELGPNYILPVKKIIRITISARLKAAEYLWKL